MIEKPPFYFRIPKTGSSSLGEIYNPKEIIYANEESIVNIHGPTGTVYGHVTPEECGNFVGGYYSFCFVRNPWDRLVSEFNWRKLPLYKFGRFVKQVKKNKRPGSGVKWIRPINDWRRHFIPQVRFVVDSKGCNMMDFVGRYENLLEDHNKIREELNLPRIDIPHLNKSRPSKSYTEFYNEKTKRIVSKLYEEDIDHFKYAF